MPLLKAYRKVTFDEEKTVHVVYDHFRVEEKEEIWYTSEYLDYVTQEDTRNAQFGHEFLQENDLFSGMEDDDFEADDMTIRGLEKVLAGSAGKHKRRSHVRSVVKKYHKSRSKDAEYLRTFARASSKEDNKRALQLAEEDEAEVQGRVIIRPKEKTSTSLYKSFTEKARATIIPRSSARTSRGFSDDWLF